MDRALSSFSYNPRIGRRPFILKILLASIGLAALAGVAAVMLPVRDVMFRLMWSGLLTAIATAITLPMMRLSDSRRTRPAGLFGLAAIAALTLGTVAWIWLEPIMRGSVEERTAGTLGLGLLDSAAAFILLLLATRKNGPLVLAVGFTGIVLSFGALEYAMWVRQWTGWGETGWAILPMSQLVAYVLVDADWRARSWWRWVGAVIGLVGLAAWLVEIWLNDGYETVLALLTVIPTVMAYANLVGFFQLQPLGRLLRLATVIVASLTGALVVLFVFVDGSSGEEPLGRAIAAGSILVMCGTLAMLVLRALHRPVTDDVEAMITSLTVHCPRCQRQGEMPLGRSECPECGLGFRIQVEPPRCRKCGYLVWSLTSDRCPECGELVRLEA